VGVKVFREYQNRLRQTNKTVIDATATPFKFNRSVLTALLGKKFIHNKEELALMHELSQYTSLPVPAMLRDLKDKKIRQHLVYEKEDVRKSLTDILQIR